MSEEQGTPSPLNPPKQVDWERSVLERIALEGVAEQRSRRRWSIFFRLLGFAYLSAILFMLMSDEGTDKLAESRHTALVQINGVISPKSEASAENIVGALQHAFEDSHSVGVILRINSPGGSPVQSGIINDEIRRLRAKYPDKGLNVVVEDICASGGYYIAAAADKIFVDKASIVGSIGVLMDGFGFTGTMEKLGVERRLLTAGENKGFLDPFSPQDARQREFAKGMLDEIHAQFVAVVRQGRGKRLKETPEMFSGLMWTGARSIELGLADGYGTVESVARDVFKAEDIRDYSAKQNIAERLAKQFGADAAESAARALTDVKLR